MARTLAITNGDSAADLLRAGGIGTTVLPWRDVLHEGPVVPAPDLATLSALRANYITERGWNVGQDAAADFAERDAAISDHGAYDAVALWFEHDLYDQLQLIQILDFFSDESKRADGLTLVQSDRFLSHETPETIGGLLAIEAPVTDAQLSLAQRAWTAFRRDTPLTFAALLDADLAVLPFLKPAILRMLRELPATGSGLTQTETHALTAVHSGHTSPPAIFAAVQERETAAFMGDWCFWDVLDGLAADPEPLVTGLEAGPYQPMWDDAEWRRYHASDVRLTHFGQHVLAGETDWCAARSLDRWIGGTYVTEDNLWRWDHEAGTLTPPS